jgi:hypothetical protein
MGQRAVSLAKKSMARIVFLNSIDRIPSIRKHPPLNLRRVEATLGRSDLTVILFKEVQSICGIVDIVEPLAEHRD